MQHTKIVEVPATTREVVDRTTCDFCGEVITRCGYTFAEATIYFEAGSRYPEGGSSEKTVFDCCPKCWGDKVLAALQSLGARPRVEELDW